jgi:hypothetical protein
MRLNLCRRALEHTRKLISRKNVLITIALLGAAMIFGAAILIQSLLNNSLISKATIQEIVSNPTDWENQTVIIDGRIQTPSIGVILPFNYWLYDAENQTVRIGVKWNSQTDLSGKKLTIVGVVKKGYAWVHPDYPGSWIYFIEANSIREIA